MPADAIPVSIQTAGLEDAEAILRLQRLAYQSEAELYQDCKIPPLTESLEALQAEFERQLFLKATCDESGQTVGSVRAQLTNGTCGIGRLIVHPAWQHQGIGRALMSEIESRFPEAQRFELFTGHRSSRNLSFYRGLGYLAFREQRLSDQLTLIFLKKISA